MTQPSSQANLILFTGGPGWWGNLKSKNFLIRERKSFFNDGANVFLFPNSQKKLKMSYADRLENAHVDSIRDLVRDIRSQNKLPIYDIYLFDTFKGLTRPTKHDYHIDKNDNKC